VTRGRRPPHPPPPPPTQPPLTNWNRPTNQLDSLKHWKIPSN